MDARLISAATTWQKNKYGINEPSNGPYLSALNIHVVIVPLLAFDKAGHRVGYGKGYYDRFLSKVSPQTITIGLSWFAPVDEITGITVYDIPLNYCVTPYQLYAF